MWKKLFKIIQPTLSDERAGELLGPGNYPINVKEQMKCLLNIMINSFLEKVNLTEIISYKCLVFKTAARM